MNLTDALEKNVQLMKKKLYTVYGNIVPANDSTVKIEFAEDAFSIISEKDLDPLLIFPLTTGEDLSGRESKYAIKLAEGTEVELHVKNSVHTFTIGETAKPFYIDEEKEEIVYLNKETEVRDGECYKRVYITDVHCCKGGYLGRGYGWVGCGSQWYDRDCC